MARLPRLIVAGLPHLVRQSVQHGQTMVADDTDRRAFLALLREVAVQADVAIHAYSVLDARFDLVLTPADATGLSRFMQALSRRHAAAFNARHARRGGLWEGRFRSVVVDPELWLLRCMVYVDGLAASAERDRRWTSLPAHVGECSDRLLNPPETYWHLGNTPFEREAAYGLLVERALTFVQAEAIEAALRGGWPLGSPAFIEGLTTDGGRPLQPRPRGRPRRGATIY
ncbi:MAG TPA: transposase [Methylibium sp.]|nr:transposase [Methylibium sp.]